jgi:2-methylcitrate dehydratase PrpD
VVRENSLSLGNIAAIRVKTFKSAAALSRVHPQDTEHAQYNLSYPIAAALIDGRLDGSQVLPPRLFDKDLLKLADIVEVEVSPEFQALFPKQTFSEVIIRTRDGRELASGKLEPKWEPPDTPTDKDLGDKFERITGPILGEKESRRLSSLIWTIEDLRSIHSIIPVCRAATVSV